MTGCIGTALHKTQDILLRDFVHAHVHLLMARLNGISYVYNTPFHNDILYRLCLLSTVRAFMQCGRPSSDVALIICRTNSKYLNSLCTLIGIRFGTLAHEKIDV